MTSTLVTMSSTFDDEADMQPYRALSKSAVISVMLGLVGLMGYLFGTMLIVSVAGLVMGLIALQAIKRFPLEYTGRGAALFGTVFNGAILLTGGAYHIYEYCTEVPEGYERVWFSELQPDPINEPDRMIPSRALELSGKKIFIKGYTHKYIQDGGKVDRFVLVPDLGECCFGSKVTKPTHMIDVKIVNPAYRVSYSFRRLKLVGTFHAEERPSNHLGLGGIHYYLLCEQVQ